MVNRHFVTFLLFFACGCTGMASTKGKPDLNEAESEMQCPRSLQVQQTPASAPALGWENRSSARAHSLFNVSFYAGPPEERAQLAPANQRRDAKTLVSQWLLSPSEHQYWVACEYSGTSATVAKPLDKSAASCLTTHDLNRSPPVLLQWICSPRGAR